MQTNKKTILFLLLIPVLMLLNCVSVQEPPKYARRAVAVPVEKQQVPVTTVANRFQESSPQKPTVVESAMELSKKHAELSEEAAMLRQQNNELTVGNQQLKEQVVALEAQLKQTQKELSEANEILITMKIELNNWKMEILGFRDEMRDAETAQLEALIKILKVLGGEVTMNSAKNNEQTNSTTVASLSEPIQCE
jgi:chromosome segregation ATPase